MVKIEIKMQDEKRCTHVDRFIKKNRQPWRNSQYKKIRQESEKRPRNPVRGVKPVKYIK